MKDIPFAAMEDLGWADGIAFCTPARYGNMAAQMKNFIDKTGNLWQKGALINKVAGVFTSTSTQHGGQETTIIITSMVPLFHHRFRDQWQAGCRSRMTLKLQKHSAGE
ncbi:MAG: NAD(P)H-dependent oxidoreductase [Candidatus Methanoperedens sp.]|nr:NAD(P)H-dependent oxidoreductase [Candidatus Methanoperedens sp.]